MLRAIQSKTHRLLYLTCVGVLGGCTETVVEPTESVLPQAPVGQRAAQPSPPAGMDGVVFLPPTSFRDDEPSGDFSDAYLADLEVRVCEVRAGQCTRTLAILSSETPPPHGLRLVDTASDPEPEEPEAYYQALWSPKGIDGPMDVRVSVSLEGVELRTTDLVVADRPRGGRSSGRIKAGSTVPIKFWMDDRWEAAPPDAPLPPPALDYLGYELNDGFRRLYFEVTNFGTYAPELFSPAPELPPCGRNTNASRIWLEIYLDGVRRYGYCALTDPTGAIVLQVAIGSEEPIPSLLGVELWDRATDRRVRTSVAIDPDLVYVGQ